MRRAREAIDARGFTDYVAVSVEADLLGRSGILLPRPDEQAAFYHFTFQDFLAAQLILEREPERVTRLHRNVDRMRRGLREIGYEVTDSPTGIIPIMIGDTATALSLSEGLLEMGVFVVGFGFPVVPEGKARLRVQMTAAHEDAHIDRALEAFARLKARLPG